jgi:cytochrome c oxidase subunit 2
MRHDLTTMNASAPTAQAASFIAFPHDKIPAYAIPSTPLPDVQFNDALKGDPERGRQLMSSGQGACLGCHTITGNPVMMGVIGPNLTHVGSRTTIAGGIYPNDTKHLSRWIKNARWMKPGVLMPTIGVGQYDPILKTNLKQGLTDEQIADIVAYLQALK